MTDDLTARLIASDIAVRRELARVRIENEKLRDIIERNLRYLALDGDGDIDWENVGAVFDSYVMGHDQRREAAEAENAALKRDMVILGDRLLRCAETFARLAEKQK